MKTFVNNFKIFVRSIAIMMRTPAPQPSAHCTNINMLLMHLCDFDADRYSYILQWLAYPLRNPGARMHYGLVINGNGYGTGASMFFQHVAVALYHGNARVIHSDQLDQPFKSWATAPLVVVDGSATPRAMDIIKSMMSVTSLMIDKIGQQPIVVANQMNFVLLADSLNSRRRSIAVRRFMVLDAPPAREKLFYRAVADEIKNGGVDAFREYLLHGLDMDGFNETTLPPGFDRFGSIAVVYQTDRADREAA